MAMTSPRLEIQKTEDDKWTIRTITMMRTVVLIFKMGEEFEEAMPSGIILKVLFCIQLLAEKCSIGQ